MIVSQLLFTLHRRVWCWQFYIMEAGVHMHMKGYHSYASFAKTKSELGFYNKLPSISQHFICNYYIYKLRKAGGEKERELSFYYDLHYLKLIGSYCKENINIGSWRQVSVELLLQNHKCFICASISSQNPTPRTKFKSCHKISQGF